MPPEEYVKALEKALSDLEQRVQSRDILNAEIAGLRETVRVLSSLVGIPEDKIKRVSQLLAVVDSATPSLTDAIRSLLTRTHPDELTATEVRNTLEDSGFNFGEFSNPLSACHAALKRLVGDDQAKVGKPKDGKTTYRAKLKTIIARPSDYPPLTLRGLRPLSDLMGSIPGSTVPPPPDFIEDSLQQLTGKDKPHARLRKALGREDK